MCAPKVNNEAAEIARREEQERQARIREGSQRVNSVFDATFTNQFFDQAARDALALSLPEIDRQYANADRKVNLGLESRGIRESSAGARQLADLFRSNLDARAGAANDAQSFANSLRSNVEQQRQQLLAQNLAAADPSQAASLATSAASAIQPTPPRSTFGDIFAGALNTAGNALVYRSQNPVTGSTPLQFGKSKSATVKR